ncbi:MAG: class I SAM-dependent methyltransferase [Actinomycetota bacterium]|nr:class I SAM-dependent methyltransferase [Actinomycetota bacterium]
MSPNSSPTRLTSVDASYYQSSRPELVELVPFSAKRVLELGCGEGRTGAAIKLRQGAAVTGVELEPAVAQIASQLLDDVRQADLDSFEFPWEDASFDCIVAADVLEHLRDPWRVLREAHRLLARYGVIIVGIPNAGSVEIISALIQGRFDYEDAGLLDRTHLRFFTRATFTEALVDAGFVLARAKSIFAAPSMEQGLGNSPARGTLDIAGATIHYQSAEQLRDLLTYQWVFVGIKSE